MVYEGGGRARGSLWRGMSTIDTTEGMCANDKGSSNARQSGGKHGARMPDKTRGLRRPWDANKCAANGLAADELSPRAVCVRPPSRPRAPSLRIRTSLSLLTPFPLPPGAAAPRGRLPRPSLVGLACISVARLAAYFFHFAIDLGCCNYTR